MYMERTVFVSFKESMGGSHDLLRENLSSLFMLIGWSSVSIAGPAPGFLNQGACIVEQDTMA
jgi:hypothetical protein